MLTLGTTEQTFGGSTPGDRLLSIILLIISQQLGAGCTRVMHTQHDNDVFLSGRAAAASNDSGCRRKIVGAGIIGGK